jgi:hypothetical protein
MGVRVYNDKTGVSVTCDAKYWAECKDHSPKSGFALWTPDMTKVNDIPVYNDSSPSAVTLADYSADSSVKFTYKDMYTEDEKNALLKAVEPYRAIAKEMYDEHGLIEIRKNGMGTNFKVIGSADGFRKDNTVWGGKCSVCSGQVFSSRFENGWTHNISSPILDSQGNAYSNGRSMAISYACPEAL